MDPTLSQDEAIQRYLEHLSIERGLAKNTLAAYGADLAAFTAWAIEHRLTTAASGSTPASSKAARSVSSTIR